MMHDEPVLITMQSDGEGVFEFGTVTRARNNIGEKTKYYTLGFWMEEFEHFMVIVPMLVYDRLVEDEDLQRSIEAKAVLAMAAGIMSIELKECVEGV